MKKPYLPILWRRLSQLLCFAAFLFLFVRTDYQGQDELSGAVNLIFRIDPLIALATSLANRTFITLLLPALFVLLASLLLGRWFCGWVCPMGTLFDWSRPLLGRRDRSLPAALPKLRYVLLLLTLVSALFGLPLVGFLDPFSILVRGLTMAIYPAFGLAIEKLFTITYQHGPAWLNAASEPVYQFLRETVLPFHQRFARCRHAPDAIGPGMDAAPLFLPQPLPSWSPAWTGGTFCSLAHCQPPADLLRLQSVQHSLPKRRH
jgi:hypothetical protein